jgi:hypothetical protein
MTGTRRTLLLLGLTVAAVLGGLGPAHPAQASFSEKVSVPSMQVTTATVAAPASVTASLTCTRTSGTLSASWPASTAARVDGYLVTVVFSDGFEQAAPMQAGTSWSTPMSLYNATTYTMHVTVAAHTNYGWISITPRASVGELSC